MKALLVLIAAITFAAAPFFSPEFGGIPPEIYPVPQDNPPVQPAGWAFAIWGIIYIALIISAAYGFMKHKTDVLWEKGRLALFVSLGVGTFWLPVALVSPIWATIMIWIMLIGVLVALYQMRMAEPVWAALLPVGLYAGWLTAASFVSIGLILGGYGVLSEVNAAIVALSLATLFALYNVFKLKIWTYGLAVTWGFSGIAAANVNGGMLVAALSAIAALMVAGSTLYRVRQHKQHKQQ